MKISPKLSIIRHKPTLHGGKKSIKSLKDLGTIDFSSNINPLGIPLSVTKQLKRNLKDIRNYPDTCSLDLKSSLSKYTHLPKNNLIVGNGAIELIYNFCFAFLSKKTRVLISIPTFQEYEIAAKLYNSPVSFFKTFDLSKDVKLFLSKIPKNGCVFLCNPNNPTGSLLSKKQLLMIIKTAEKKSSYVFVDECFIELVDGFNESIISYVKKYENLFVLRSLTKSFGFPGLRIGYAASNKNIINILEKIKIPWSVNILAQSAAQIAIKNKTHLTESKSLIKKERDYLIKNLSKLTGFECHDSLANFILIKTKFDSTKLQKKLLKHKILIRDCKNFRGLDNHFFRIAVKSHKENVTLIKAMENFS